MRIATIDRPTGDSQRCAGSDVLDLHDVLRPLVPTADDPLACADSYQ
jgi:hypothetical protein